MTVLVERASVIPHGGTMYIEHEPGERIVVWLDESLFTAEDAAILAGWLKDDPVPLLKLVAAVSQA